jgi:hypothetical protein
MRFSVRRAAAPDTAPAAPAPFEPTLDLARFERLIETAVRLRDAGIAFEDVERRAAADEVSWNRALEEIDRERSDA